MVFFASQLLRKILFKFLFASMKTVTNSGDFTGSRIRISDYGGTSKKIGNLHSAFANNLPDILKSITLTGTWSSFRVGSDPE